MSETSTSFSIERRETLLHSPKVRVERLTLALGDDHKRVERLVHDHGSAVAVLPVDPARRTALLTRQIRFPVVINGGDERILEPCAGLIDDGETPEETMRREAMEEMGLRLRNLEKIAVVYTSPGFITERVTLFLAEYGPEDRVADGGGKEGEGERIELCERSLASLRRDLEAGRIVDAKLFILLQALLLRQPDLLAD